MVQAAARSSVLMSATACPRPLTGDVPHTCRPVSPASVFLLALVLGIVTAALGAMTIRASGANTGAGRRLAGAPAMALKELQDLVTATEAKVKACDPMVQEEVAMMIETAKQVIESKDTGMAQDTKSMFTDYYGPMVDACAGGAPTEAPAPEDGTPAEGGAPAPAPEGGAPAPAPEGGTPAPQ